MVFECVNTDGRPVVLKVAPAEMRPAQEAAALRHWAGRDAPRLLDFAPDLGGLLLERITPGSPLPPGNDEAAIRSIVGTLRALHGAPLPDKHPFPTHGEFLEVWFGWARADAEVGTIGIRLLDHAREVAKGLLASTSNLVLIHGDFIDKNLLLGPDGYLAIDPMPRSGDPCSDVGLYAAYHPPARRIAERARAFARAADLDPERAALWAAMWAVGEATQTWRKDSDELQQWVAGEEATILLGL
jgi:streptomycin 6-kinase